MASLRAILGGCGTTGPLVQSVDWSATSLGPFEQWPEAVQAATAMVLSSGFPLSLTLGPDPSSARVVYNDAFITFLGHKHPAAMGRCAREVWPEAWDFIEWALRQVWHTGQPVTGKDILLRVMRGDGPEEIHASISWSPIRDDDGRVCGSLACSIETTATIVRERRERALRTLAEGLGECWTVDELARAVTATLSVAVKDIPVALLYLLDAGGRRASLRAFVGLDPVAPGAALEIDSDTDAPCAWEIRRTLATREASVVAPIPLRPSAMVAFTGPPSTAMVLPVMRSPRDEPAGALVVGLGPARPLDDSYSAFLRCVAREIGTALANIRSLEEARARAEVLAESRLKDMFLGLASHELRTPLTCLKLNVQLVQRRLEDKDPMLAERLAGLHRSIDRMTRLVREMLSVSAVSAGKLELQTARCDLRAICRDAASEQAQATHRSVQLDLPSAPVPVDVDADRIGQVVSNLLSNAFKYSPVDRPVTMTLRTNGGTAIVTVRDEGPGIPAEAMPHLFERYYRVPGMDVQAGSYLGLGLGLFLAKTIVEQHGGRIWVEGAPGKGSAFSFSVPLSAHDVAEQSEAAASGAAEAATAA